MEPGETRTNLVPIDNSDTSPTEMLLTAVTKPDKAKKRLKIKLKKKKRIRIPQHKLIKDADPTADIKLKA